MTSGATSRLSEICSELGLEVNTEQIGQLQGYVELLWRWRGVYNLVGARSEDELIDRHVADCLTVVRPLSRHCTRGRVLDAGSGAGLPGVVLGIVRPELQIVCADSSRKKITFVAEATSQLLVTNVQALHSRLETIHGDPFDVIVSRAFSSLADLVRMTTPLLHPQGRWIAMKGKRPDSELERLDESKLTFHVEQISIGENAPERCLVWMSQVPSSTNKNR